MTISQQHGGYNLIKESGCDQAIRRAISERYGMAVDVQFDGVLSLEESDPAYKEIIGKPSLTPEMKAALERPSNAPKPSASRGEAGGKAGDKPSKPGRLLFDCEDLPFVPDSGVLILGKPIKENRSRSKRSPPRRGLPPSGETSSVRSRSPPRTASGRSTRLTSPTTPAPTR